MLLDVERVDDERLGELRRRARELRQHQHAVLVDACRAELLGDQVHAVAQRRHEHDVGGAIEREQLVTA